MNPVSRTVPPDRSCRWNECTTPETEKQGLKPGKAASPVPLFSRRTLRHVPILVVGAILVPVRRVVSSALHDACWNGTKLKVLPVVDEFTRECLAIEVATSLPAARVIAVLARLFATHGAPAYLRSDNGPEFVAHQVRMWLALHQAETLYIDPGCPWQNAFGESFNGSLRDECLNMSAFASVAEARILLESLRRQYNEERPHSRLGYRTPAEFKADWLADQSY